MGCRVCRGQGLGFGGCQVWEVRFRRFRVVPCRGFGFEGLLEYGSWRHRRDYKGVLIIRLEDIVGPFQLKTSKGQVSRICG